jgi:hypothetical protein
MIEYSGLKFSVYIAEYGNLLVVSHRYDAVSVVGAGRSQDNSGVGPFISSPNGADRFLLMWIRGTWPLCIDVTLALA